MFDCYFIWMLQAYKLTHRHMKNLNRNAVSTYYHHTKVQLKLYPDSYVLIHNV